MSPSIGRPLLAPAALTLAAVSLACSGGGARPIEFTVCGHDEHWAPPSEEEQAQYLSTVPRYAQAADAPLREVYRAALEERFLQSHGANSALQDSQALAGLWDAGELQLAEDCLDTRPLAAGTKGDLWLLLYEARALTIDKDELFLTVAPVDSGFQVIQWKNPLAPDVWSPALHVVDVQGDEIYFFPASKDNPKSGG